MNADMRPRANDQVQRYDDDEETRRHSAAPRSRRRFLGLAGASIAGATWGWPVPAKAATPPHVFTHGAFEISVVSDGHLVLPTSFIAADIPAAERDAALAATGQTGDQYQSPTNCTLIRTPSDLILVDTGSGAHFVPTAAGSPKIWRQRESTGRR